MKKVLLVILMCFLICGCGKKVEEPIPEQEDPVIIEDTYKEITKGVNTIDLNEKISSNNEVTPYSFNISAVVLNPALLTLKESINSKRGELKTDSEEVSSEENDNAEGKVLRSISLSNEIMIKILFSKMNNEIPKKIILSNIEIINNPKKGELKFYQLSDITKIDYIDKMRDNEITDTLELTNDLYNKALVDGEFELRFSATIEKIMTASREELIKNDYVKLLKSNNITNDDISFKISFIVSIISNTGTYSLPFTYDSTGVIDMYSNINYKGFNNESFIYFVKVK